MAWKWSRFCFAADRWQLSLVSGDPPIVNIGTVVQATIQGHNVVLASPQWKPNTI